MAVKYANIGVVTNNLQYYINQDTVKSFRGEATTNMVSAGYESFETAVGSYNTSAQFTASRSTDISYFGNTSLFCTRGTGTADAYANMESYIAVSPNTTYTLSSYVYLTEITTNFNLLRPTFFDQDLIYITETQNGIASDNLMTSGDLNKWRRKYVTFTTPALCNYLYARYNLEAGSNYYPASFYADGRQLEQKSYMTPFVSGTRTNTVIGNGGLMDISASGNNSDLTGAALFFNSSGFYSTGGNSTSTNQGIAISPVSSGFNTASNGSRTYEIWCRLLGQNNNAATYLFARTGNRWDGFLQGASPNFANYINYVYYYNDLTIQNVTFNGSLNTWYHAACTIDLVNSGAKLYINSELKDSASFTKPLLTTSGNYYLNGFTGVSVPNAMVDQVRVYNTVLSQQQIRQNFDATKSAYGYV